MRISSFNIYQYSLPLARPLVINGKQIEHREGLIINLNQNGLGEIAPLPGLSRETLQQALKELKAIRSFLFSEDIPAGVEKLDGHFQKWFQTFWLKPSVQFGIEMAVLNLLANTKNMAMNKLISQDCHDHVRIHGLIQGSQEEAQQEALALINEGFTALKLKVGPQIHEEIVKVKAVSQVMEGRALLRIDANQSWTLNQALEFGQEVGCAAIDYIEEPFKNLEEIPEFFEKTTIPVALDESLQHQTLRKIKSISGVETVIFKPTIVGGLEKTRQMIQEAHTYGLDTVVSSSFESSLGISALAHLAGTSSRDHTAGLDTLKWFEKDLVKEKIEIEKGKMNLETMSMRDNNVNFTLLKEVF